MRLHAEEAEAGPWRRVDDDELREILTRLLPDTRAALTELTTAVEKKIAALVKKAVD